MDGEGRAPTRLGINIDDAVVSIDDAVDDGEAESDTLAGILGGEEWLEDSIEVLFWNAPASIADDQPDAIALPGGVDPDAPSCGCRLEGVHGEGQNDLLHLGRVADDSRQVGCRPAFEC